MEAKTRLGSNYAWLILLGCIGFYAIPVGVVGNTSGIFVTPVMDEFGWDRTTATLYMTIQPWVAAVCTPFAGKILRKYDPRIVLALAGLAYGLSTIWTAYGTQPWIWHVYGVIYGISCSFFMFLAVPTLLNLWFKKGAGKALGIAGATLSIIAAICAPLGQSMISSIGWQQTRLIFGVIITVVPVILTLLFVRKSPESMGVLPYGADEADVVAANGGAQVVAEGAEISVARRSIFYFLLILVAGFLVFTAAFFQQIPSFAATGSLGAAAGAVAVSIIMIGGTIGKFIIGWVADRFGSAAAGVIAGICGAVGLGLALFAGSTVIVFYVGMVIFGMGYSALGVVPAMLAREGFGTKNYTELYSWVATGIFIFSGLAALSYGRIYDATGSFTPAFILVIVLYLLVAVMSPLVVKGGRRLWVKSA